MDFGSVFRVVGKFFIDYCSINVSLFGIDFTVGGMLVWCAVATIMIMFFKGVSS